MNEAERKEYREFWHGHGKRDVFSHSKECDKFFEVPDSELTADVQTHLGCKCWCHYGIEYQEPESEVYDDGGRY